MAASHNHRDRKPEGGSGRDVLVTGDGPARIGAVGPLVRDEAGIDIGMDGLLVDRADVRARTTIAIQPLRYAFEVAGIAGGDGRQNVDASPYLTGTIADAADDVGSARAGRPGPSRKHS